MLLISLFSTLCPCKNYKETVPSSLFSFKFYENQQFIDERKSHIVSGELKNSGVKSKLNSTLQGIYCVVGTPFRCFLICLPVMGRLSRLWSPDKMLACLLKESP